MSRGVPRTDSEEEGGDVDRYLAQETITVWDIDPAYEGGVRRIVAILSPPSNAQPGGMDDIATHVRNAQRVALRLIATARGGDA